jgi:hypothetical protein
VTVGTPIIAVKPPFKPFGECCDRRVTVGHRANKGVQMIGHGEREQDRPLIEALERSQADGPRLIVASTHLRGLTQIVMK